MGLTKDESKMFVKNGMVDMSGLYIYRFNKDIQRAETRWMEGYREGMLRGVSTKCDTPKETITTIAYFTDISKKDDTKLNKVADILVQMNKAFNSPSYCEGINKYNVRGIYRYWAGRILEVV